MKPMNTHLPHDLKVYLYLAMDASEHKYAERYAFLYHELLKSDNGSALLPFSISELKQTLEKLSRKEQETITKVFGLNGGNINYFRRMKSNDIALINMLKAGDVIFGKLRSLNMMNMFVPEVQIYIERIAKKVWDPENKYDNVTKAKYACIYYIYLLNFHHFPNDSDDIQFTKEFLQFEKGLMILPYIVREAYNSFFVNQPDGDLVIEMIDEFFDNVDTELKETVYSQAQLTQDVFTHCYLDKIRNIKERLFPYGSWQTGVNFFLMSSITNMSITKFRQAARANRAMCNEAPVQTHTEKLRLSTGTIDVIVRDYYKDFHIVDQQELFMYANLHAFLATQCPTLPLGKKKIPFKKSAISTEIFYLF